MLVDPGLWEGFNASKDALFRALQDSVPPTQHVFFDPPASRADSCKRLEAIVDALSHARGEIQKAQADLDAMSLYLLQSLDIVRRCTTPVGALPVEILREVFSCALDPRDHGSILSVAAVCRDWRSTVLSIQSLFADAAWDDWPSPLLELWRDRACGCALTVRLGASAVEKIGDGTRNRYNSLLEATKPSWGSLFVHVSKDSEPPRFYVPALAWLFERPLRTLKTLDVDVPHATRWDEDGNEEADNTGLVLLTPFLQTLRYSGVVFRSRQRLFHLESLVISADFPSRLWFSVLQQSPSLTRLTFEEGDVSDAFDTNEHRIALPRLIHFRMKNYVYSDPNILLDRMSFPGLTSLDLTFHPPSLDSLMRLSNHTRNLTRFRFETWSSLEGITPILTILNTDSNILPNLVDLELLPSLRWSEADTPHNRERLAEYQPYVEQVIRLVTTRDLSHLSLPVLATDAADIVRAHVKDLNVAVWHTRKVMAHDS